MTTTTKALNAIKDIFGDEFTSKSFAREICWTLSRSLDPKNRYSIPATITQTVGELKTLLEEEGPAPAGMSTQAERKMDFIESLETKQGLYESALTVWKAFFSEVTGSEFQYSSQAKADDSKRRDVGQTRKHMDELLKKYAS